MAEEQHDTTASGAPDAGGETQEEVLEAEVVEAEVVTEAPEVDPVAAASESLAAAAAAADAVAPEPAPEPAQAPVAEPVADWQLGERDTAAQPQYVVVEAPLSPVRRGNRGIGALLALAGAVIYGGVLVGVAYLLEAAAGRPGIGFLQDWHFYLPVALFAVAFIIFVVLVNRAGWWSYILGSLVVGLVVYLGTAGGAVLIEGWMGEQVRHSLAEGLLEPFVLLAAILGREVAVWWGWLIAYRGRRVTARNRAAQEAYEHDMAEFRARYGA